MVQPVRGAARPDHLRRDDLLRQSPNGVDLMHGGVVGDHLREVGLGHGGLVTAPCTQPEQIP